MNQAASANYISDIAAGEHLTVEVSGYTHKGLGVARHGREVIFIPGALHGEKLMIELLQKRKGIWQAKILEALSSSPERIASLCP
ncbi:MAG: 23S rRNA (uracil(1939)-C(5))-methyltransferase RlmD, partial [Firmicutes bacterium]|nr:23S rRNA (uracil(1939)-C(5))-methyltransferase RlmD [Bacillota bacterium]